MKARKVFENIEFKRGHDSKRSLGVGQISEIRKWWRNNITNRPEVNFSSYFPIIWFQIQRIAKEEGINLFNIKPSGQGGSWNSNKHYVQTASTIFHMPGHLTHYFNFDVDEEGDVWVTTPQYLTGEKAKHELGSMTEDPIELVHNLGDYLDDLENEVIPHFQMMKGKLKLSEAIDFVRGKSTKDALQIGEISHLRDKLKNLKYTNEIDEIIESIRDTFNELLQGTKYAEKPNEIVFKGAYRAGSTDYAGIGLISLELGGNEYTLYLYDKEGGFRLFKPYTDTDHYMGNLFTDTLKEILDNIIDHYESSKGK